jgi:putative SOS response-associated peptidase YedK
MCGRFTLTNPRAVQDEFHLREEIALPPRYNIAPSQTIPIIKKSQGGYFKLALVRWGLIPYWAKDPKISSKLINARAETLAEKPAFRAAYRKRRCLIPADGFFEWKREGAAAQPYYIRMKNKGLFTFAGLWEQWKSPEGETVESATIITTNSNSVVARLHDRMPLIVKPEQRGTWLDLASDPIRNLTFLQPYDPFKIVVYPVSKMVNDAKYDSAGCVKRVDLA